LTLLAGATTASAALPWRIAPAFGRSMTAGMAAEPQAASALRPVEHAFLQRAAELSREQLQLAKLAVGQATSSDVRTYAQQVASDYRQIDDSLEALRRRKGTAREVEEPGAPVQNSEDFQHLAQQSGPDFDREFVRIAGDLQAIVLTLFEEVMAEAKDSEVRDLIGNYLPVLRGHRNRTTELRKIFD
jgi:putative membrane protein